LTTSNNLSTFFYMSLKKREISFYKYELILRQLNESMGS
jgi:hypothetical protein